MLSRKASDLMNYKEAIQHLNLNSYSALYTYISRGLPVITMGKSKRISRLDADEFQSKYRDCMNYGQAMKYLHIVSYNTLHDYINDGLKVTTLGGSNFIRVRDAESFLVNRKK